ncbi:MAG TPA: helix-turn-helix domain-containing protein [Acidimicrobiia bacterium]|jgi:DNA-binding HxlR family transcriptional regulator|nr:helix-turn-helix domain-containing protein [Acidimicrobiia bacterium]
MSTPVRYDQQYCPIARALDVLGDRWTLLIIRELGIGDQRFTELRRHLPGIAPTVLTQRLRELADEGLVTMHDDPSTRRQLYALTDRGREAGPVLRALARWGMPLLEPRPDDRTVRPRAALNVAILSYYDAAAAAGIDERYRLEIDGETFTLSSVKGGGKARATADVELVAGAGTWIDIRQGRLTLQQARKDGLVQVTGPARSVANFRRVFRIP